MNIYIRNNIRAIFSVLTRLFTVTFFIYISNSMDATAQNLNLDSDGEVNSIASDILKGGYILYFRHASKQKIEDSYLIDQLAAYTGDTELDGTCLNYEGKIESKAMGAMLKISKMNIGKIYSSPMCRSKQTAVLSMGHVDEVAEIFIYPSLLFYDKSVSQQEALRNAFKQKLKDIMPQPGEGNSLVFAHNSTIESSDYSSVIDDSTFGSDTVSSGGFHVLKVEDDTIKLIYSFDLFHEFSWEVVPLTIQN